MNDENKRQIYFFEYHLRGQELQEFQEALLAIRDDIEEQLLETVGLDEANDVINRIKAKL